MAPPFPKLTLLRTAAGSPPTVTQYQAFQSLGCRIVAADCDPASVGFQFADAAYVVPKAGAAGYLERMLEICRREAVDLFLPALDEELELCGEHREAFEALGTRLPLSSPAALAVCADKLRMAECFERLGIPTARTVPAGLYREGAFARFPLIVKPRRGRGGTGVQLARDHAEAAFFARYVEDAVVQEHLDGVEYTLDVLAGPDSGLSILSPRQRLATESGVSSKGATHWMEGFVEPVRTLVRTLGMVGPLNFQCFVSPEGRVAFTEINARLAGTAILSQAAGVPLFEGILDLALGREPRTWLKPCAPLLMFRYWAEVFHDPGGGRGKEA